MTYRSRLAVLAFVACLPAIAGRLAQADPAAQLSAAVEAQAAASSEQAVSAAIAREDAALQRAIDRKLDARMRHARSARCPCARGALRGRKRGPRRRRTPPRDSTR